MAGGGVYGSEEARAETAHTAGYPKDAVNTQFKDGLTGSPALHNSHLSSAGRALDRQGTIQKEPQLGLNKPGGGSKYEEMIKKSKGVVMPRLMEFSPKYGLTREKKQT